MHVEKVGLLSVDVDHFTVDYTQMFDRFGKEAKFNFSCIYKAMFQLERFQLWTSLTNGFKDGRSDRLVVHSIAVIQKSSNNNF